MKFNIILDTVDEISLKQAVDRFLNNVGFIVCNGSTLVCMFDNYDGDMGEYVFVDLYNGKACYRCEGRIGLESKLIDMLENDSTSLSFFENMDEVYKIIGLKG